MVRQARQVLVDPGEREEEVISAGLFRGMTPLTFALSLLLHCAVLFFSPALLPLVAAPRSDEKLITLELLNSIRQRIRRESAQTAPPSGQNFTSLEEQLASLDAAGGPPERITAGREVDLSRVRAIRAAIYSLWDEGSPPELGQAMVLLPVDGSGHLVQTWIKALQGERGFQEYMQEFLKTLELPDSSGDELWLECEFVVK